MMSEPVQFTGRRVSLCTFQFFQGKCYFFTFVFFFIWSFKIINVSETSFSVCVTCQLIFSSKKYLFFKTTLNFRSAIVSTIHEICKTHLPHDFYEYKSLLAKFVSLSFHAKWCDTISQLIFMKCCVCCSLKPQRSLLFRCSLGS